MNSNLEIYKAIHFKTQFTMSLISDIHFKAQFIKNLTLFSLQSNRRFSIK